MPAKLTLWAAGIKSSPPVVQLLNMRSNPVAARLAEIVEACHQVRALSEKIGHPSTPARRAERDSTLKELNARLSDYRWHPVLAAYTDKSFYFHTRFGFKVTSHEHAVENQSVEWIVRHVAEIDNIRHCARPECDKWHWAAGKRKKYCTASCRALDHQKGTAFKQKRADYMKKYRKAEKKMTTSQND